jgi:hypothetical protein
MISRLIDKAIAKTAEFALYVLVYGWVAFGLYCLVSLVARH